MNENIASGVLEKAKEEQQYVVSLLQHLIQIPSMSRQEGEIAKFVESELQAIGIEGVGLDSMGSVVARCGNGAKVIVYDSHLDTVGIGNPLVWKFDPFSGRIDGGRIFGRGASDDKGCAACMIGALKLLAELDESKPFTLYVLLSVQEEDCEGLALEHFLKSNNIRPDCVLIGEPSDLCIMRGHRGRAEIEVVTHGRASHGSMPEAGENAVYKMARIVRSIEWMQERFRSDPFLGRGSAVVTSIESKSPSRNTVPDVCRIFVDRRTVPGDSSESIIRELEEIARFADATVSITHYQGESYTGLVASREKFFPAWSTPEDDAVVQAAVRTFSCLFDEPRVDRWLFSTDGNYSRGVAGIPTVGFGPGEQALAHVANETIPIDHLWRATAFYTAFPYVYCTM